MSNIIKVLMPAKLLLKLGDEDTMAIGKVFRRCLDVQSACDEAAVNFPDEPDMKALSGLWAKEWVALHNPVYSFAYAVNPEYHRQCCSLDSVHDSCLECALNVP